MKLKSETTGKIAALAILMFASACTTTPGANENNKPAIKLDHRDAMVARRGATAGIGEAFNAPYGKTVDITRTALANQKLTITSIKPGDNQTIITFSSPLSLFSYGEVGRIIISDQGGEQTQLYVTTASRAAGNITAKGDKVFAREIYGEIAMLLKSG